MFWNQKLQKDIGWKAYHLCPPVTLPCTEVMSGAGSSYILQEMFPVYTSKNIHVGLLPFFSTNGNNCTLLCTLLFSVTSWRLVHVRTYGIFSFCVTAACYSVMCLHHKLVFPVFLFLNLRCFKPFTLFHTTLKDLLNISQNIYFQLKQTKNNGNKNDIDPIKWYMKNEKKEIWKFT